MDTETPPPRPSRKGGRKPRVFVSIPFTKLQKVAVLRRARELGLSQTNYLRMQALAGTRYNPDDDPDFGDEDD